MKQKTKNILAVIIAIALNFILFLYFLTDVGTISGILRVDIIFMAIAAVLSVFFGYFEKKWWLVFLVAAGIMLLGIRAIFLNGGITYQWVIDLLRLIPPVLIMEVMAFSGSIMNNNRKR
jgi:presenilin-like A22 family membrane protease